MASAQCALTMYSTESAMMSRLGSEYSMPSWPMAMPSSTAIVLNSLATPPAASISRATSCPRSFRCTWPGTNWVNELTTAMIGFWKSSSFMPVARQSERAPAMLRPAVEVLERYAGIVRTEEVSKWGSGPRGYWPSCPCDQPLEPRPGQNSHYPTPRGACCRLPLRCRASNEKAASA